MGLTLPKFFTEEELQRLLASRYPPGFRGRRDRAILEVLAATGLRASELLALRWDDIKPDTVFVRNGKGGRQRYVPISRQAWDAVMAIKPRGFQRWNQVFRNAWGKPLSRRGLYRIVRGYIRRAGLKGSTHTLRHTLATRLLNRGMHIRGVQVILGHAWLQSTTIYTHCATDILVKQYREAIGESQSE